MSPDSAFLGIDLNDTGSLVANAGALIDANTVVLATLKRGDEARH